MQEEEKKCEDTMPEVYVNQAEIRKIKPSKFP